MARTNLLKPADGEKSRDRSRGFRAMQGRSGRERVCRRTGDMLDPRDK